MTRYLTSALRDGYLPCLEELAKLEDVDIRPKRKRYRPPRRRCRNEIDSISGKLEATMLI